MIFIGGGEVEPVHLDQGGRSSNIELFRIVAMLSIIAHHYVVNSGVMGILEPFCSKSIYLNLFGMWGKIGINCFVLITGYFMCTSKISLRKFLKLLLEIEFYKVIIYAVFLITGYEQLSVGGVMNAVFPVLNIERDFVSCYLIFYLTIPFLNLVVHNINQKQHIALLCLCLFVYSFLASFPNCKVEMNYVSWFIVLYFIASYIRFYPIGFLDKKRNVALFAFGSVLISMLSVVVLMWIAAQLGRGRGPYYMIMDANKPLAVLTAISLFVFFKSISLKQSKFINTISASTFAVLLIHASSNTMREWLWRDVLNIQAVYYENIYYIIIHSFISIFTIFSICIFIDRLRTRFIEKPIFSIFDKKILNV